MPRRFWPRPWTSGTNCTTPCEWPWSNAFSPNWPGHRATSTTPVDSGPGLWTWRATPVWQDPWPGHWCEGAAPAPWDPEPALLAGEVRALLGTALADLPERQRAVVELRDVHGFAAEEVCTLLDLTPANQRVLLHRGRVRLRAVLEKVLA